MKERIDLRSDTVTLPTTGMKEAMITAPVGDDVFGSDPSVNALEEHAAGLFAKEAGLFCPSGTMTNQIAVFLHADPLTEIIIEESSHIYQYEVGGVAFNSRASVKPIQGDRGKISSEAITNAINPDDIHKPRTSLVCLENTTNRGGGATYSFDELQSISQLCWDRNLKLHLDGARLFNALVETNQSAKKVGPFFDTISICLSKGLGAPVGSLLLGKKETIRRARQVRKVLGGGMRQAGYLAAAGHYALTNHIERLREDHQLAEQIRAVLRQQSWIEKVFDGETNIILFDLIESVTPEVLLKYLEEHQILAVKFGPNRVRFVTHLDIHSPMVNRLEVVLKSFCPEQ